MGNLKSSNELTYRLNSDVNIAYQKSNFNQNVTKIVQNVKMKKKTNLHQKHEKNLLKCSI